MNRKPIFDAVKAMLGRAFTQAEVAALDAAIDAAEGIATAPSASPAALSDGAAFYAAVRAAFGGLTQSQVDGFGVLLQAMGAARWPLSWAAYGLATAWWETNNQMEPVVEAYWLSEAWRKANLRYYPWHGRGYVQLTWEANYKRADEELGLNGALLANPDLALRPDIAANILVKGMEGGWFSGKGLGDYLPHSGRAGYDAYRDARHIINGTDRADKIAKIAQGFEAALIAGGWA